MFDWLFEGLWQVYAALGIVALLLVIVWSRHRRRYYLYGIIGMVALALVYLLLDFAVETDSEQIGRRLQAMSKGVRERDLNAALTHVADNFTLEGKTKTDLRNMAEPFVKSGTVTDLAIWDYRFVSKTDSTPAIANVTFKMKVKGNQGGMEDALFFKCEAQFEQQPDKSWLLKGVRLFNPANNSPVSPHDLGIPW